MLLKSTRQEVVLIPWSASAVRPWPEGYQRVAIITPKHHKNSVQIVRDDSLVSPELEPSTH